MYHFLWVFFIYAFLGWCTEVSYAALNTGQFINRGFLNGPLCPIYGFGMLIVLVCLTPLQYNLLLLFFGSVLLTTALELATGFILEKLFHQHWWDYSDKPFQLGGYVCLQFSVLWGLGCLLVVELLHPSIEFFIGVIPAPLGWIGLGLFCVVTAVDLVATVGTIAKINSQLSQIDELAAKIKAASNEFGETLADTVLDAAEKGSDWRGDLETLVDSLAERREDFEDSLQLKRAELLEQLNDQKELLEDALSQKKVELQEGLEDLLTNIDHWKQALDALLDKTDTAQRRLLNAFPRIRSIKYTQAMNRLRRRIDRRRNQAGK